MSHCSLAADGLRVGALGSSGAGSWPFCFEDQPRLGWPAEDHRELQDHPAPTDSAAPLLPGAARWGLGLQDVAQGAGAAQVTMAS